MLAADSGKEQIQSVKLKSLEDIFRALQEAEARYLVVGGLAVIAHGYVRLTKDIDLVLDLSSEALPRALNAQDLHAQDLPARDLHARDLHARDLKTQEFKTQEFKTRE